MKTAAEWDLEQIGNLQADYVLHCGQSSSGEYLHTISLVDIASSWWEGEPILRRNQQATRDGLDRMRNRFPFAIREIHPDNDTGFINDLMWNYCKDAKIKMSRSRPYKKNDNAWVEQRNWTQVRKQVGYSRMESQVELEVLRELYEKLALYKNFFQPTMKLVEKIRKGGKIHRKYDEPRTAYQRVIASKAPSPATKKKLQQQYGTLNVAQLHRQIGTLKNRLFDLIENRREAAPAKTKRHGPSIRLNSRAHAIWMEQMLGKRRSNKEAGQKQLGDFALHCPRPPLGSPPNAERHPLLESPPCEPDWLPGDLVAWRACADCFRSHSVASALDIRSGATPRGQSQPSRAVSLSGFSVT